MTLTGEPDSLEAIAVWCAGEYWCLATTTASIIGEKWHPVFDHRLLEHGPSGFNELKDDVDGISSKVLSACLEDLEEKQLLDREIIGEKPVRVQYSLTRHGEALEPVIEPMRDWGVEHHEPMTGRRHRLNAFRNRDGSNGSRTLAHPNANEGPFRDTVSATGREPDTLLGTGTIPGRTVRRRRCRVHVTPRALRRRRPSVRTPAGAWCR